MKIVALHAERFAFAGTRWPVHVAVRGVGLLRVGRAWRVVAREHIEVFLVDVDALGAEARDGAVVTLHVRAGTARAQLQVQVLHRVPVGPPGPRAVGAGLRVRPQLFPRAPAVVPRRLQVLLAGAVRERLRPHVLLPAPPFSSSSSSPVSVSAALLMPSASEMP